MKFSLTTGKNNYVFILFADILTLVHTENAFKCIHTAFK